MTGAAAAQSDRDLASIAEARALARRAKQAWLELAEFSQERVDAIVDAMAAAATPQAEAFARLAVEETGYGVVEDKVQKNLFSSQKVYNFIRPMKTVGVVARHEDRRVVEIAEPFGVVAAVVPSTNPTSTAIYKILISIKARCAVVLSPHPAAVKCISAVAEVMEEAARRAGAPAGAINWMTTVTLEGTQELMKHRDVAVILATGGMGLVRAAYCAGKPAYGVGPGNAPAYIERTADVRKAARDIVTGKTFDNGVLCSSENSVVVDEAIADAARRELEAQGAYFMSKSEIDAVARVLVTPQRLPNPALVGKSASRHRGEVRRQRPRRHPGPDRAAGRSGPRLPSLDREALSGPLLLRREGLAGGLRALQADPALRRDGPYHVHPLAERAGDSGVRPQEAGIPYRRQQPDDAWLDRPHHWPRPGDDPRLRRLRREHHFRQHLAPAPSEHQASGLRGDARAEPIRKGPRDGGGSQSVRHHGGSADTANRQLPGLPRLSPRSHRDPGRDPRTSPSAASASSAPSASSSESPLDFVCEDDVRAALASGRTLLISERAIVTPAARDLGEQHRVFRTAP